MRDVVAEFKKPVTIGKDSSVLLHIPVEAFYPGKLPFPLMHVYITWKFRARIDRQDRGYRGYNIDIDIRSRFWLRVRGAALDYGATASDSQSVPGK